MKRNFVKIITAFSVFSSIFAIGCKISYAQSKNDFKTVKIGHQEWSVKNLDVSIFRNGDSIPEARTDEEWAIAGLKGEPAWCYYNNDPTNEKKYGKLYNWYAVNDPRGLCPEGWHIATHEDWGSLTELIDAKGGEKLKANNGWDNNGNGTDSLGFSAFPAGIRYSGGNFDDLGRYAHFWTSTETNTDHISSRGKGARAYFLSYREENIGSFAYRGELKGNGMSLRCMRRSLHDDFSITPNNPPNDGILFVDHEESGRSGHGNQALIECKNGELLAFYCNTSGVLGGGHGVAGWTEYKRSSDGGKTWSEPTILEYSKDQWDGEEILSALVTSVTVAPNGTLVAMIARYTGVGWIKTTPVYLLSYDHGYTWSEPRSVDSSATVDELSTDYGASFIYENVIYFVFIGGSGSAPDGPYSFYASEDNGETFIKRSDYLFANRDYERNFCYSTAAVLDDGSFIVYSYNIDDEENIPFVISKDKGYTWSEVKTTFLEKRIRNPQISEKIGGYYFMHGRSGNWGDMPRCLVLYSSVDGVNWDRGRYLNKTQQGGDSYSTNEIIGKYSNTSPKKILIQSSISYSGHRVNIKHWWIEKISRTK